MGRVLAFIVLAALAGGAVAAEPVPLEYFNFPPYSYEQDGQPAGTAITLAQSLVAGLDIALRPEILPIKRINFEAAKSPFIVAAIVRNAERDDLYHWIGPICADPMVFATLAPHPPINGLDEARKLKKIAMIGPTAVWMAATKSVPEPIVEALRARLAEKIKDGTVAAVTNCPG